MPGKIKKVLSRAHVGSLEQRARNAHYKSEQTLILFDHPASCSGTAHKSNQSDSRGVQKNFFPTSQFPSQLHQYSLKSNAITSLANAHGLQHLQSASEKMSGFDQQ